MTLMSAHSSDCMHVDICLVCRCENLTMGAGWYTAWEGSLIPMCSTRYWHCGTFELVRYQTGGLGTRLASPQSPGPTWPENQERGLVTLANFPVCAESAYYVTNYVPALVL